jgi:16S rRNA C967 or C1407 C5-methylase (RsmB/RsmF family)
VLPGPSPADGSTLQLTPLGHGTDGFFVSVFERISE